MNQKYPHIFEPLTVKRTTFKNRIVMPPMGSNLASMMGEVTERVGYTDGDGNEAYYDRQVSWDAMKEIITAALRALADMEASHDRT